MDSAKELSNARLLNKMWNQQALITFREKRIPMARLVLDRDRFVEGTRYFQRVHCICRKHLLFDFKRVWGMEEDKLAPFGLKITWQHLLQHNHYYETKCLIQNQGSSLTELDISMSNDDFRTLFPANCKLPACRVLSLQMTGPWESVPGFALEELIIACPNLQELKLPKHEKFSFSMYISCDIDKLVLPRTLTVLQLDIKLESTLLQAMGQSLLPNLKYLSLLVYQEAFTEGEVYQLLDSARDSLERLVFLGEVFQDAVCQPTYLAFPKMSKLRVFEIESVYIELDKQQRQELAQLLPEVCQLKMNSLTSSKTARWSRWFKGNSIREYYVGAVDTPRLCGRKPGKNLVKRIYRGFPNLTFLTITLRGCYFNALKTVFQKMDGLERLKLIIGCLEAPEKFTNVLLGFPQKDAIKENGSFEDLDLEGTQIRGITLLKRM